MSTLVNIAEMKIAKEPMILICIGLGSCIGVALYDPIEKIGGVAHVMLPDSKAAKSPEKIAKLAKFADTAIEAMIKKMVARGANIQAMKAKIFGGANIFPSSNPNALMMIGERNIQAVCGELIRHQIPLVAKDVGGNSGRTIYFEVATGMVTVKMLNSREEKIF